MHPFHVLKADSVTDADTLQTFIMQQLGVGYVTKKDTAIYRKKVKELFEHYPQASMQTMVRTVEWAKDRRRRFARLHQVVEAVRYAYEDGYLPELDPTTAETDLDDQIRDVLMSESDPAWRKRLLSAQGTEAKRAALEQWAGRSGVNEMAGMVTT